jgi:hypothetical protein
MSANNWCAAAPPFSGQQLRGELHQFPRQAPPDLRALIPPGAD